MDKKVAGVCAGLARYLQIDVTLLRIIVACAAIWGVGIVFYVICWFVMPLDPIALPPAASASPVTTARA